MVLTKAEINKRYNERHPGRSALHQRNWRKKHPERAKAQGKKWVKKNLEVVRAYRKDWMRANSRSKSVARKLKKGSVWMGRKWEIFAAHLLGAKDMNEDVMNQTDFDLLWNGKRVEVKSAELLIHQKGFKSRSWSFRTGDTKRSHYYLLICLKNGSPYKIYLVPSSRVPKGGTSLFEATTKYNRFEIKTL